MKDPETFNDALEITRLEAQRTQELRFLVGSSGHCPSDHTTVSRTPQPAAGSGHAQSRCKEWGRREPREHEKEEGVRRASGAIWKLERPINEEKSNFLLTDVSKFGIYDFSAAAITKF